MKNLLIISLIFCSYVSQGQDTTLLIVPRKVLEYHVVRSEQLTIEEKTSAKKDSMITVYINTEFALEALIKVYKSDSIQFIELRKNDKKLIDEYKKTNSALIRQNVVLKTVNKVSGGSTIVLILLMLILL